MAESKKSRQKRIGDIAGGIPDLFAVPPFELTGEDNDYRYVQRNKDA